MRLVALALSAALAGSIASAAPVPKEKPPENPDLAAIQGKWKLTDVTFGGKSLGAEFVADLELTMEVRGSTATTVGVKHKQRITSTLTLDVNATPRRMTTSDGKETDLDGKPVPNPDAKKASVAIYKLDGDTLTVAGRIGDESASKDFAGDDVVTMTYTRVKK